MELKPWEFGILQPHEFMSLLDGYNWRKERREDMFAYFTCWLVNTQLKESITPARLLEPLRQYKVKEKKKSDEEYLREKFKERLG